MFRSLAPWLPALDNPAVFYVVTALLAMLAIISIATLFLRQTSRFSAPQWLRLTKHATALTTWFALAFWLVIGAGSIAFAGAVSGSLAIIAVGIVAFIVMLPLLTLLFVAWSRDRGWADGFMLFLVVGFCTTIFTVQRLWICEPMAWSGVTSAQLCTARHYTQGTQGAIRNSSVALSWYGLAAKNGSEEAVGRLLSTTSNKHIQRQYLEEAALAGNGSAMYHLSILLGPAEGKLWLDEAIASGNPQALYQKSNYVRMGEQGFDKNTKHANTLLEKAAELGASAAAADLALMYEAGERPFTYSREDSLHWASQVDKSWPNFAQWQTQLAVHRTRRDRIAHNDPAAILEQARIYRAKASREAAYKKEADDWFERAADAGSADAQFELAFVYFKRTDANEKQRSDARRWLTAAADQQHRYALSNLSHYLTNGQYGFAINLDLARDYAKTLIDVLSAESPPSKRDLDLAHHRLSYIEQLIERQDYKDGTLDTLQDKAARGDAQARYRLAYQTLSQPRTPDAEVQAYAWMQDAAMQGHRGALVFMGRIHLRGLPEYGFEKNPELARGFFEKSLEGLEGDVVYARRNGSITVSTTRQSVERLLAGIENY